MSSFLVTGGAGFIGSHIVERLLKDGHGVCVLDNFSSGKEENLSFTQDHTLTANRYTLIKGDITDKSTCDKSCKDIDYTLHQAALRSVPKSMFDPRVYNEVNINGTLNMLEASLKNKVKCFVFASSSSVYGETDNFPEKESAPPRPISPYALTKLAGEHYCSIFSHHYGLPTISLRYFNVFGPRQSLDDEYAVVIPKFINCLLKGKRPPIYGTGRQSRDFTYVQNVVEANILAAKKNNFSRRGGIPHFTGKGEIFNVAGGKAHSILELLKVLNKITKKDISPVFLPPRPGDIFKTEASLTKAKRLLGFEPKINFIDGLKLTIEYFQKK